mgnify:CR=1 FL=1
MAKKSMIEREKKRIKLNKKYATKRSTLLKQYRETEDFTLQLEIHSKIQKLPRNSAKIRIRNRCWKTGRPRGFYRMHVVSGPDFAGQYYAVCARGADRAEKSVGVL